MRPWLGLLMVGAMGGGCARRVVVREHTRVVYVAAQPAPPAPIADERGGPPSPDAFWVDGHWEWNGREYAWHHGRWEPRRSGEQFVQPRWIDEGGRWVFKGGHWKPEPVAVAPEPVEPEVIVQEAPPPPRNETVPPPPSSEHVWVGGHWKWEGNHYVWFPGHYEAKRVGYVWDKAHWQSTPRGWRYVPGHWKAI